MSVDVVSKLLKRPLKDKSNQKAKYERGYAKDLVHQADLLSVYEDRGNKYILVVVDAGTRLFDAMPIKSKTSSAVLAAFKKIYDKKAAILKPPTNLQVDKGTEFHGDVLKWFLSKGTQVRFGRTARHRQQALVEARNQSIGTMLYKRMMQEEFITGQKSTEWVGYLPQVVQTLNDVTLAHNKTRKEPSAKKKRPVEIVLEQGTKVRPVLEQPIGNLDGSPLTGHFRATDIRFDPEVRTIVQVILHEGKPAMYVLNNPESKQAAEVFRPGKSLGAPKKVDNEIENVAYTRNQLQVVTDDETYGDIDNIVIDKKNKNFDSLIAIAEKITGEKPKHYMVKYRGYKEPEAQPKKDFANSNEHNRELIRIWLKAKK